MIQNAAIRDLISSGGITDSGLSKAKATPDQGGEDFGKTLLKALEEVNGAQNDAKGMQRDFLAGKPGVEIHDVMIAGEKASTAMQLTLAVRNKALEAFQEINRLPV